MYIRRALPAIVIVFLMAGIAAAEQEVTQKANLIVTQMQANEVGVWDASLQLEQLGAEAAPVIEQHLDKLEPTQRIAAARALCRIGNIQRGVRTLAAVVRDHQEDDVAVYAAELLTGYGQAEGELVRLLQTTKRTRLRIALAQALWSTATTDDTWQLAHTTLNEIFRAARGEDLKACALALAHINDFSTPVVTVLEEIANEPGPRGGHARALLDIRKLRDVKLDNLSRGTSFSDPVLTETARLLQMFHVEPPKSFTEMRNAAVQGLSSSFDPFTRYYDRKEYQEFRESMSGNYAGIGARVGFLGDPEDPSNRQFCVIRPIYSGPSYRAGIRSYDEVLKINGEPTNGKELKELVDSLRGPANTQVEVTLRRQGFVNDIVLRINRENIHLETVYHRMLPGKIGYLKLLNFGMESVKEFTAALNDLEANGMRALVIDFRNNPGGLLTAAVEISDMFLRHDRLIVRSVGRDPRIVPEERFVTSDPNTRPDYPIVVMINGGSASASEIVAGALQDYQRAVLVGQRTYGKGSVQRLINLESEGGQSALKVTIAKYYLPSGRSIHRTNTERGGVQPDIEIAWQPRIESEDSDKFERLRRAGSFDEYTLNYLDQHRDELMKLAEFDGGDASAYPGFNEWFDSLTVPITQDLARILLRSWIRIRLSDAVGNEMFVDIQDDDQLGRAVAEALLRQGDREALGNIPQYQDYTKRFNLDKP